MNRIFPPEYIAGKGCRDSCIRRRDIPQLRDHLSPWDCRCTSWCLDVCSASNWSEMGNGYFLCPHGDFALLICHRQHRGIEHWFKFDGVLLPEHVQRHPLRLDTRSIRCTDPWYCLWLGQLLGSDLWHCFTDHRGAHSGYKLERRLVPGGRSGFHLHDSDSAYAHQTDGCSELLGRGVKITKSEQWSVFEDEGRVSLVMMRVFGIRASIVILARLICSIP